MADVIGVVLAAGAGTRMGTPKAELSVDGSRLVDRAVVALSAGGCSPVLAVVRAGVTVPGARVVVNPEPERGMRSSLSLAVTAAIAVSDAGTGPEAIAVLLVDTPGVGPTAVRAVLAGWRPGRIAVARYGTSAGHPTVMSPALWLRAVEMAGPDEGARAFLAVSGALLDEIPAEGDPLDLDSQSDLARWRGRE